MTNIPQDVDIVIVGGGLVGNSLALACRQLHLSVLVIEKNTPRACAQTTNDARALSLSLSTKNIYSALGLWSSIAAHVTPITTLCVSEQGRFAKTRFSAKEARVPALGYVIPAQTLIAQLTKACCHQAHIHYLAPAQISELQLAPGADKAQVLVEYEGKQHWLQTNLLVACDGVASKVRRLAQIATQEMDYDQCALVANVSARRHMLGCAYERFTPEGPVALLPLTQARNGIVWIGSHNKVDTLLALSDQEFCARFMHVFGYRLGALKKVGARSVFPLKQCLAKEQIRHRLVLLGSSANHFHPLAAQGLNLALRDVATLLEVLDAALARGEDYGALAVLHDYQQKREADQKRIIRSTDGLLNLFGRRSKVLTCGRSLGMLALDALSQTKYTFVRYAMGVSSCQSRLVSGVPLLASRGSEHTEKV